MRASEAEGPQAATLTEGRGRAARATTNYSEPRARSILARIAV